MHFIRGISRYTGKIVPVTDTHRNMQRECAFHFASWPPTALYQRSLHFIRRPTTTPFDYSPQSQSGTHLRTHTDSRASNLLLYSKARFERTLTPTEEPSVPGAPRTRGPH